MAEGEFVPDADIVEVTVPEALVLPGTLTVAVLLLFGLLCRP